MRSAWAGAQKGAKERSMDVSSRPSFLGTPCRAVEAGPCSAALREQMKIRAAVRRVAIRLIAGRGSTGGCR